MKTEKQDLEAVLGHSTEGIRQHYLNLELPRTWRIQSELGLGYDASLGSRTTYGYATLPAFPFLPFPTGFVALPLTLMDGVLFRSAKGHASRVRAIESLINEADSRHALLTILWHQRFLNPREFPEEFQLYEFLVRHALNFEPWVATAGEVAAWWRHRSTGS